MSIDCYCKKSSLLLLYTNISGLAFTTVGRHAQYLLEYLFLHFIRIYI